MASPSQFGTEGNNPALAQDRQDCSSPFSLHHHWEAGRVLFTEASQALTSLLSAPGDLFLKKYTPLENC